MMRVCVCVRVNEGQGAEAVKGERGAEGKAYGVPMVSYAFFHRWSLTSEELVDFLIFRGISVEAGCWSLLKV